jgi:hypothetical protein
MSCIQRSPRPDGDLHALGKACRKADSICREHVKSGEQLKTAPQFGDAF